MKQIIYLTLIAIFFMGNNLFATMKQNFVLINSMDNIIFPVPFSYTTPQSNLSFYVWDGVSSYENSIKKLTNYNDITIYLNPIDEGSNQFAENTQYLHDKNANVWFLLSAIDLPPLDYIQNQVDLIAAYNKNHTKQVLGISFDVEPWIKFKTQNSNENIDTWKAYLDFMSEAKNILLKENLKISITIPFWLDTIPESYPNDRPINYDVLDIADEVLVMAYTIYPERILPYTQSSLAYADTHQKHIKIALEMVKNENEEISFYTHPEDIKPILNTIIPYLYFDGYILHDLDNFNESNIKLNYTP